MIGGYVYILINSCMPGVVKIGHSTRPPEDRAREISQVTGVPVPFVVAYEEEFGLYYQEAEQEVHTRLDRFRFNQNREFFSLPLKDAIRTLAEVARDFREREGAEHRQAAEVARAEAEATAEGAQWSKEPKFRLVDRLTIRCPFCSELYTVTFQRYEDHSCCPRCHRGHKVDIKW